MQQPDFLKSGSTIGLIAPAGKINPSIIPYTVNLLQQSGFNVKIGKFLTANHFQFAASDFERTQDFQAMLDDQEVNAILCMRGGYGCIRIVENLDFSKFTSFPKWLIGFSDITVIHSHLNNNLNIASIHGPMPKNFIGKDGNAPEIASLFQILKGDMPAFNLRSHELNKTGSAKGEIIGGNLSILSALRGTPYDIDTDGKILFIEDLCEYLYHIDRIMYNLKIGGKLKNLSALVVGQFTDLKDNDEPFGQSLEEIILNVVDEYDYPVVFDFPAGHISQNMPIIFGKTVELNTTSKHTSIRYL